MATSRIKTRPAKTYKMIIRDQHELQRGDRRVHKVKCRSRRMRPQADERD